MDILKFFCAADEIIIDEIPYENGIWVDIENKSVTVFWEDGNTGMDGSIVFREENLKSAAWDCDELDIQDENGDNYTIKFIKKLVMTPETFN